MFGVVVRHVVSSPAPVETELSLGGARSGTGVIRTPAGDVGIRGGTPGGGAGLGCCMYRLRMVRW